MTEVSVLYQHLCKPRESHPDALFHILNYLNVNSKSIPGRLGLYNLEHLTYTCPIKGASTENKDWVDFYPDAEESLIVCQIHWGVK